MTSVFLGLWEALIWKIRVAMSPCGGIDRALAKVFRHKWKKKTMRLVFSLMENPETVEIGRLLFGVAVARNGNLDSARHAFAGLPDETLTRYVLPEAAAILAESDPDRARALLGSGRERWGDIRFRLSPARRYSLAVTSAYLGDAEGVAFFTADIRKPTLIPHTDNLKQMFAVQQCVARRLGTHADYASIRKAVSLVGRDEKAPNKQLRKKQKALARQTLAGTSRCVIGLLDYRNPVGPTTNLGDYILTIATIGQLSRFSFDSLEAPKTVRSLLAQGQRREGETTVSVRNTIKMVPVNRDFPLLAAAVDGPLWLPVCCQLGREAYPGHFDFPFPDNIRPLFLALQIADPTMLTEECLDYLRRFEPIGCQDLFTARLLRGAGMKAFFNGCVTMTLDRLRPPHSGSRMGRYHAPSGGKTRYGEHIFSPRDDENCLAWDFDGNLHALMGLLDRYHTAEEVRTGLVHCWLPCRAMGVPVTLMEEVSRTNPRLYGLADLSDEEFRNTALRFEAVAQPVLAAIIEGKGEAEVYTLWQKITAPAMARTDAMVAELNAEHPLPDILPSYDHNEKATLGKSLGLDRIPVKVFGPASNPDGKAVHLLFVFDENLAEFFPGTLEGVWRHQRDREGRPLTVHVFGRGLRAAMFAQWAEQFPGVRFVWHDLSGFAYTDDCRLDCITVSAWDYLLAPEILPDVEKIVYLDVDILVRRDISDLFDINLGNTPLAACRDANEDFRIAARKPCASAASDLPEERFDTFRNAFVSGVTTFEGFNTGVIVMNLARMRSDRAVEKMFPLLGAFGLGDHWVINFYARKRRMPLAEEWNHIPTLELMENPAIVHFVGLKPWEDTPLPFCKEWRRNATNAQNRWLKAVN